MCASLSAWVCSLFSGSFLPWSGVPVCGWGNLTTADAAYTATMPSLVVPSVQPTSPPAGPVEPSTLQPSCAPSPWRRMTFFPTGSHIVPASPHARGAGTLQQAGGTSKAGRPTAAACRSSSQLQFVIIIKGLTSEASLPLFTPLPTPDNAARGSSQGDSSYPSVECIERDVALVLFLAVLMVEGFFL